MSSTTPFSADVVPGTFPVGAESSSVANLAPPPPGPRRFTVDEFYRMAEAGILTPNDRVELIHGEVLAMNPIGSKHSECVTVVSRILYRHSDEGKAFLVRAQNPLLLDDGNEVQPDFAFIHIRSRGNWDTLPSVAETYLVIEVSDSSLQYDRDVKVPLYAKFGVPEMWIVDLSHEKIEVRCRPNNGIYEELRTYHRGDRVTSNALPQVSLEVSVMFGS